MAPDEMSTEASEPASGHWITACPACGGTRFEHALTSTDDHFSNPGTWEIQRCGSCRLMFLNPMPSESQLADFYPSDYYSFQHHEGAEPEAPATAKRTIRSRVLARLRRSMQDPEFARPGVMLDIGCGAGDAMSKFAAAGWEVVGVEPSTPAALAGQRLGLDIRTGSVIAAGFASAHFDYIRASHSFEHVPNPVETLAEIRRIIKPSGRLMLALPNVHSAAARYFGRDWFHLSAPVHTFGYQPRNLRLVLSASGFEVLRVRFNSGFLGITGSQRIRQRRLADNGVAGSRKTHVLDDLTAELLAGAADLLHRGDSIEVTAKPV